MIKRSRNSLIIAILLFVFTGCELKKQTPTREAMQGTWSVEEAYVVSGSGSEITDTIRGINIPVTAFHLSSDNSVVSTAGPMWMHLVLWRQ